MVTLQSISFRNYKCFEEKQTLELKPLTVFFGRNGSGKTAAMGALPFLLRGCAYPERGLPLLHGHVGLIDMIHGYKPHGSFGIGGTFDDQGEKLEIWVQIQSLMTETQSGAVISTLTLRKSSEDVIELNWIPDPQTTDLDIGRAAYNLRIGSETWDKKICVTFNGIWPMESNETHFDEVLRNLSSWRSRIAEMISRIVHLGALRPIQPESIVKQSPSPKGIGINGKNALQFLEANQNQYLNRVASWFAREDVGNWRFSLEDKGNRFETILSRGNLSAPLNQVGHGLGQVFPIVVQRSRSGEGFIEIIEEPESHLHVSAHGALADLFIPDMEKANGLVLAETHSEMFLLRLRLRVAEAMLSPDHIGIYWVEDEELSSYIKRIDISSLGELENWPEDIFLEDYEELLALRSAIASHTSSKDF